MSALCHINNTQNHHRPQAHRQRTDRNKSSWDGNTKFPNENDKLSMSFKWFLFDHACACAYVCADKLIAQVNVWSILSFLFSENNSFDNQSNENKNQFRCVQFENCRSFRINFLFVNASLCHRFRSNIYAFLSKQIITSSKTKIPFQWNRLFLGLVQPRMNWIPSNRSQWLDFFFIEFRFGADEQSMKEAREKCVAHDAFELINKK